MNLSPHCTLAEAIKSETAIRLSIDNTPPPAIIEVMKITAVKVFEPCREFVGGPLGITSFYRCPDLNEAIGSGPSSQHIKGEAIDEDCDKYGNGNNLDLFKWIRDSGAVDFDQLIWEYGTETMPAWVHVSHTERRKNRRQVLRAVRGGGHIPFDLQV